MAAVARVPHSWDGRPQQSNSSTKTTTVCCDFHTMSTSSYFLYSLAMKDIIQISDDDCDRALFDLSLSEIIWLCDHFDLPTDHVPQDCDDDEPHKSTLMEMIRELRDETRKDIRQNEILCEEPQRYGEEDINNRIIYGLKVLRAASKTTKLTKRWRKLRTLSPIPSTTGNPGYGRPLTITKTQVDRMMFVLRFILELRLIRATISKRTLMYIEQPRS